MNVLNNTETNKISLIDINLTFGINIRKKSYKDCMDSENN